MFAVTNSMQMETVQLASDIQLFCVTAKSFPDGVLEAHQTLHALFPYNNKRKYFGISWPDKSGNIIYKAAAEELVTGELANHNLETKTIPGGNYLFIDVPDLMKNIPEIGKAFDKLIHDERIDPNGFCIEWYLTQDLCRCMVKTK